MTCAPAKFEAVMFNCLGGDAFTKKSFIDLAVKIIRTNTKDPLHRVTYASAKFEVATPNSLGRDAFTREI